MSSNPLTPASQCVIERISLLVAQKGRQWRAFHASLFSAETVSASAPAIDGVFSGRLTTHSRFQRTRAGDGFDSTECRPERQKFPSLLASPCAEKSAFDLKRISQSLGQTAPTVLTDEYTCHEATEVGAA